MKVILEYAATLKCSAPPSGSSIELPTNSGFADLLDAIGISPAHQKALTLFINDAQVRHDAKLAEGDRVYVGVPMGGG